MTIIILLSFAVLLFCILFCTYFDQGRLFRKGAIYKLPDKESLIALTFDDGPDPVWTPQVLNILKKYKVKATFFVLGYRAEKHPELILKIAEAGHAIGNHSYDHGPLWCYSAQSMLEDIARTQNIIHGITGRMPVLFRPPKGLLGKRHKQLLHTKGYKVILWSMNSKDWAGFSAVRIAKWICRKISAGEIILFHDGKGAGFPRGGSRLNTIEALDEIIPELQSQDFQFVPIEEG